MPFVSLSVSARVPVCANLINPHDCGTRGNHGLHVNGVLGKIWDTTTKMIFFTMLCYKQNCHWPKNLHGYFALMVSGLMASLTYLGILASQLCETSQLPIHSTDSYLAYTSMTAAAAAELAATRRETKYIELSTTYHFVLLAFDSLGPISSKATIFFKELGRRLTLVKDNPLETAYLFRCLSVTLQRFNTVCILGCFGGKQDNID